MLVRDIMSSPVAAVPPETTLEDGYRMMREKGIRHLLVFDGERVVGVVTDRDLRLATSALVPSPFPPGSRVDSVMVRDPLTASPSDPVEDAARVMRERKIGCLPVMDENDRLVGIITGVDLLDALLRMTGVDKPSGRLEVRLPDLPGELARLTSFFASRNLNVLSVLTYPEGPERVRTVLRVGSIETRLLAGELRRAGFDVVWPPEKPWPR
ncbi:MAG TPA: CBS and ACT domain-containing protein [Thermoanaerobaculia bacterium]|jgi:acetoin utilization protein AcuB|nr:CBS and ACT domain-containing protein [Thermoanaerobaculia bacterium]